MKKIGIVLAIVVGLTFIVGCPTTDTGNAAPVQAASTAKTYSVDLNTLNYKIFSDSANSVSGGGAGKKNTTALAKRWDGVLFTFSGIPADVTKFNRVTVNAKYFAANGDEIAQGDGKAMCVLIYDLNGDLKGPEMGPGKNTPVKEFNVGGFSGLVSTDKGVRVTLNQAPGGILVQAADASVKFIELTQVTFHSGSASGN
jgi:hypothetical protein